MSGYNTSDTSSKAVATASRPKAARRRPFGHPALLLLLVAGVLFGAYVVGNAAKLKGLTEETIRSSEGSALPALSPAVYGFAGLAVFLVFISSLRSFGILLRRFRKATPRAKRPPKSVAQFIEEAAASNIGLSVAREGFHLLTLHQSGPLCIDLADSLCGDLALSQEQIRALDAQLLSRCERCVPAGAVVATTVFDLLTRVETAAPRPVVSALVASERSGNPASSQAPSSNNPASAQRKALHAAALRAIEARSRRSFDSSGLLRRSSDYEGPRRRATDDQRGPFHEGPFRRTTDRPSAERKAKAALDSAKLDRFDPRSAQPINQRSSDSATDTGPLPASEHAAFTSNRRC